MGQIIVPPVDPIMEPPVKETIEVEDWMKRDREYTALWNDYTESWTISPF